MLLEKLKDHIMYFSLQERKKRALVHYQEELGRLAHMSDDEIALEYITTKADYEHQKRSFIILLLFCFVSLIGSWKAFFYFVGKAIDYMKAVDVQDGKVTLMCGAIIILFITSMILLFLWSHIKSIDTTYRSMLTIEEVRKGQN